MEKPARRVMPSLNALRAFEATARHRSMTLAAEELFVTHGAVSRHIKSLEDTLGVVLLNRKARSTEPTPEGVRLAEGLATALDLVHASVERIRPGPLTLSCSSSIMMSWIIPRIAQFHERYPQVELQFNMNYDRVDFVRDRIGMAIRSNVIDPPDDAVISELVEERIGPVCSPEYLETLRISDPSDFERAWLLSTRTRPEAWLDWQRAAGCPGPSLEAKASFDHFYLLIQAAACGLGVAVVPQMLVLDQLQSGRLVAPFGFTRGTRRLVLWIAPHLAGRADTVALQGWLTREMRQSVGTPGAGNSRKSA
ncbi:MAG: LysR substrate-binding domain-containing protein [Shinella sp.]|nr:LysR substrate-binding domain-containing protein [Shinella sp.]